MVVFKLRKNHTDHKHDMADGKLDGKLDGEKAIVAHVAFYESK